MAFWTHPTLPKGMCHQGGPSKHPDSSLCQCPTCASIIPLGSWAVGFLCTLPAGTDVLPCSGILLLEATCPSGTQCFRANQWDVDEKKCRAFFTSIKSSCFQSIIFITHPKYSEHPLKPTGRTIPLICEAVQRKQAWSAAKFNTIYSPINPVKSSKLKDMSSP